MLKILTLSWKYFKRNTNIAPNKDFIVFIFAKFILSILVHYLAMGILFSQGIANIAQDWFNRILDTLCCKWLLKSLK